MKLYFTFGTNPEFPFPESYALIWGVSEKDCLDKFRQKFPDRTPGTVNCSDWYTEAEWKKLDMKMKATDPAFECYTDDFINGFDTIWIKVPSKNQIIQIDEGSGCNLDSEDAVNGYIDYVNYTQYSANAEDVDEEIDGGEIMYKEYVREKFSTLEEAIPDVLDMAFDKQVPYSIIGTPASVA